MFFIGSKRNYMIKIKILKILMTAKQSMFSFVIQKIFHSNFYYGTVDHLYVIGKSELFEIIL